MASCAALNRHQLAGLDERERGFSRPVELESAGQGYRAVLRYERVVIATEPHDTQDMALQSLIRTLQSRGYRQLKTQMSFRDGLYLGSQETWIEYPDSSPPPTGWLAKLVGWFQSGPCKTER